MDGFGGVSKHYQKNSESSTIIPCSSENETPQDTKLNDYAIIGNMEPDTCTSIHVTTHNYQRNETVKTNHREVQVTTVLILI